MRNKRRGNSKRRKTGEGESSSRFIKMQKSRGIAKISFSRIAANLFGFVSLAWRVSGIAFLSLLEREGKILKLERERERRENKVLGYRRWIFSLERKLLRIRWNVKADRLEWGEFPGFRNLPRRHRKWDRATLNLAWNWTIFKELESESLSWNNLGFSRIAC